MYIGKCLIGLEEISCDICNGKKVFDGLVKFSKLEKYGCFNRIYKLEGEFEFKTFDEIIENVKVPKGFKVVCSRKGEHNFKSVEVERELSKGFESENLFFVDIIKNKCFYGELVYKDLCKRDYRVKLQADSVDACVAYCMLKLLNIKKGDKILDPFSNDGIILIEASKLGCEGFGLGKNIRNARINSKVANVKLQLDENEDLSIMKIRFEDINVCSYFPATSKRKSEKMIFKKYKQFFDNASVVNKMCILSRKREVLEFAKRFKLVKEYKVEKGSEEYYIFLFERKVI